MGWGGNSQWRTALRRDYIMGSRAYLNVDAREWGTDDEGLDENRAQLTDDQREELLEHRCLVRSKTKASPDDLWPFDLAAVVPFP
jgi:hypothetical protein